MIKNSSLGMQFRTCEKFWESTDSKSSFIPKFFTNTKAIPQILELDSNADSTKSSLRGRITDSHEAIQNKNNLHEVQTESRPIRGAKNRIQGRSSASADFLLESEKRGSPPKSEKAVAFWRVGGAGRGVQPFLRKEIGESKSKRIVGDSNIAKMDSSLTAFAQNDESFVDCHENSLRSFAGFASDSRNDRKMTDFANQAQKNNRRNCGGGFVFVRIFGIEIRIRVCEIPKILASAKDARMSKLPRNDIYLQIPHESTAFKANLI